MSIRSCSFTGHRQIKKSHIPEIEKLVDKGVAYAYSEGCRDFYAGGAIGFDTISARAVIRLRREHPDVRLILCLPCVEQSKFWTQEQIDEYENIISEADELIYVSKEYTDTCIKERNMMLAERADLLIAYVGRVRSGSSQTAKMAERLGKMVYNIYPVLEKILNEKEGQNTADLKA